MAGSGAGPSTRSGIGLFELHSQLAHVYVMAAWPGYACSWPQQERGIHKDSASEAYCAVFDGRGCAFARIGSVERQAGRDGAPAIPANAKATSPVDLTGAVGCGG